jgi:type 1 glutamine amidotransferase
MFKLKFWGMGVALLVMVFCVGVSFGSPRLNGLKSVLDLSDMGPVGHPVADGDTMLKHLSAKFGFQLTIVKTPVPITRANLQQYDVVIFNQTSWAGTTLNADEQLALHDYLLLDHGSWIGWHGAGATHASWTWYIDTVVGADFLNHGGVVKATMYTNFKQYATNDTFKIFFGNVPDTFSTSEEWYNLTPNPYNNPNFHMLQFVDESSYGSTAMGPHHPVTWCQILPGGGRTFYCSRGHTSACFTEVTMDSTIWDALQWCGSPLGSSVAPEENFLHSKGLEDFSKWNFNEPTRLNVYNLAGQLVASRLVRSLAEAQNAMPAGCHIVRIMDGSGRTARQMTVVR